MKNTLLISLLCVALGFAAGWFAKPDSPSLTNDNPEATARPATRELSSASPRDSVDKDRDKAKPARLSTRQSNRDEAMKDVSPKMKKQIEEMQRKQKELLDKRIGNQFEMRITSMVRELGLNADQEKAAREFFDAQLEKIDLSNFMSGLKDPDQIKEMAAALRGDGLNDYMKNFISEDQLESLEALQQRKNDREIDSQAMKDLAKLQQSLDLSDDQKDKVYGILIEDVEKSMSAQSDGDYLTRAMMSSMGVEMDLGGIDMGSMMTFDAMSENSPTDTSGMIQKMKDARQKRIDTKVERLTHVLDAIQLGQYRKSLESNRGMFDMMIQGMEQNTKTTK